MMYKSTFGNAQGKPRAGHQGVGVAEILARSRSAAAALASWSRSPPGNVAERLAVALMHAPPVGRLAGYRDDPASSDLVLIGDFIDAGAVMARIGPLARRQPARPRHHRGEVDPAEELCSLYGRRTEFTDLETGSSSPPAAPKYPRSLYARSVWPPRRPWPEPAPSRLWTFISHRTDHLRLEGRWSPSTCICPACLARRACSARPACPARQRKEASRERASFASPIRPFSAPRGASRHLRLLRLTLPRPKAEVFLLRILATVLKREETPAQSPWWLTPLRMLAAAVILAENADPVFNPRESDRPGGPLVLFIDNGWATHLIGNAAFRPLRR